MAEKHKQGDDETAHRRRFASPAFLILALVTTGFVTFKAHAEPILPEYLQMDYENCIAEDDSKRMKQYCNCFVNEIEEMMSLDEHLKVSAEIIEQLANGASEQDVRQRR